MNKNHISIDTGAKEKKRKPVESDINVRSKHQSFCSTSSILTPLIISSLENHCFILLTSTAPADEAGKRRPRNSRPCRNLCRDLPVF